VGWNNRTIAYHTKSSNTSRNKVFTLLATPQVIALVNLLERLSKSIEIVRTMSLEMMGGGQAHGGGAAVHGLVEEFTKHPLQQNL